MRDQDLADSPLASHCDLPSNHVDTVQDFVREAVAGDAQLRPLVDRVMDRVIAGLEEAEEAGVGMGGDGGASNATVRGLQMIADFPDWAIAGRAIGFLRMLGHEGKSFEEIGRRFGIQRQTAHILFRSIQRAWPKFRSRGDKSDASRADCEKRRTGARKPKIDAPARKPWKLPTLQLQ